MAYDYSKLSGRIAEICGTQTRFSQLMGWSERTTSMKMNCKVDWKKGEILKACSVLHISVKEIPIYFFAAKAQD